MADTDISMEPEMPFLDTDHGLINLNLATRIMVGTPARPWARTPVNIDMVDGTAVRTAAHQQDMDHLDEAAGTIIPAHPGWQRVLWMGEEDQPEWEPVIAWQVHQDRTVMPICAELLAASGDWALVDPTGRVSDVSSYYASVEAWLSDMRQRLADREQSAA